MLLRCQCHRGYFYVCLYCPLNHMHTSNKWLQAYIFKQISKASCSFNMPQLTCFSLFLSAKQIEMFAKYNTFNVAICQFRIAVKNNSKKPKYMQQPVLCGLLSIIFDIFLF